MSETPEGFSAEITSADQITPRRARWLMGTRRLKIPMGELTIFAGREGAAKSQFTIWLIALITRGTLPGELHGQPRNVIICAREDSWEHTIVPRLIAAGADLSRVKRVKVRNAALARSYDLLLPLDNDVLRKAVLDQGAALVIFDPLLSVLDGDLNTHRASDVRKALEPLADIAHETGCPMGGLAHFAKTEGRDAASLISGSHAFKDVARAVVVFARDSEDTGIVSQVKNNLGKLPTDSLAYSIETVTLNINEGTPEVPCFVQAEVPRFVMGLPTTRHVEDLLDQGKAREIARARDFLRRELADGAWHLSKDVTDAASQEDISERTLKRARMALGIVPRKENEKWWMSLPTTTTTTGTLGLHGPLGLVGPDGTVRSSGPNGPSESATGPTVPTVPAIPRARAREASWFLKDDGSLDWASMWAVRDPSA